MRKIKRKGGCCSAGTEADRKPVDSDMTICFIGNPNCGKTTLFNAYTGANLKVAKGRRHI